MKNTFSIALKTIEILPPSEKRMEIFRSKQPHNYQRRSLASSSAEFSRFRRQEKQQENEKEGKSSENDSKSFSLKNLN